MNARQDLPLFTPIEPYRTGSLSVVYLHGGPGSGTSPQKRQWFDPAP